MAIKVSLVRWRHGNSMVRVELTTETFETGESAMHQAHEWLQNPHLKRPGTYLCAYPGIRPDGDTRPVNQEFDAITTLEENDSVAYCLEHAEDLNKLQRLYGTPAAWKYYMRVKRGFTVDEYFINQGDWIGEEEHPPQELNDRLLAFYCILRERWKRSNAMRRKL